MGKDQSPAVPYFRGMSFRFLILLGFISLCGSMVSNGARSVIGPYLMYLGGSAAIVGIVAGFGEVIGYGLRPFTGVYLDRRGRYWSLVGAGYALLAAIPLLAFAWTWEVAAVLIGVERVGKAIRTPSRDSILSYATAGMGRGWGFGIHKALDQVGAIIGPLILALAFAINGGYRDGFLLLLIPLALMAVALVIAHSAVPRPVALEEVSGDKNSLDLVDHTVLLPYATFIFLSMAGFATFPVISYHLAARAIVPLSQIPILYTFAMFMSGAVALIIGRGYDRFGTSLMVIFPLVNMLVPFFAFSLTPGSVLAGILIWGAAVGMQQTVLRATIADFTVSTARGTAYGVMNAIFGIAWFIGSVVIGVLYEISQMHIIYFVVIVEALSLCAFFWMRKVVKPA